MWAAKKLGVPLKERVTGIDLFQRLIELSGKKGYKIYLFGAKEEVVTKVKKILEDKYPNIQIVGYRNGYFTEKDEPEIVKNMAESGADMMFVAFSSPKKEYWVNKYLKQLNIPWKGIYVVTLLKYMIHSSRKILCQISIMILISLSMMWNLWFF